jgi:hypothetical protein
MPGAAARELAGFARESQGSGKKRAVNEVPDGVASTRRSTRLANPGPDRYFVISTRSGDKVGLVARVERWKGQIAHRVQPWSGFEDRGD